MKRFIAAVQSGFGSLSPNCREAARLQSHALDTKLPFSKRTGLWLHLLVCKWCRRYGRQIAFLEAAAREHPEQIVEGVPQKLSAEARERIRRRLQAGE